MNNFFRGWRRKTGCVMLMLALTMLSVWMRSYTTRDEFDIKTCVDTTYSLISDSGTTEIVQWTNHNSFASRWIEWRTYRPSAIAAQSCQMIPSRVWGGTNQGPDLEQAEETGKFGPDQWASFVGFSIPYVSIVIPLTLLSAWQLLIKPRKRIEKEPAAEGK